MYIYCQQNQVCRPVKIVHKNVFSKICEVGQICNLNFDLLKIVYYFRSILFPFRREDWSTLNSNFTKTPSIDYTM